VTEKGRKIMDKYNLSWTDAQGKIKPITTIVEEVSKVLSTLKKDTDKSGMAAELFGLRGVKGFNALASAGKKATDELQEQISRSSEGVGVAAEMASKRLDNLKGQLVLLKSSVEGLAIKVFGPMLKPFASTVKKIRIGLNNVLNIFETLKDGEEGDNYWAERVSLVNKFGHELVGIAEGFRDAVNFFRTGFGTISKKIQEVRTWIRRTFGTEGSRKLTAVVSVLAVMSGLIGPILMGLMMVSFAMEGLSSVASGIGTILSGSFIPLLIIGPVIAAWFFRLKREGESTQETFLRMWQSFKEMAISAYELGLKPFIEGIMEASEGFVGLGEHIMMLGPVLEELLTGLRMKGKDSADDVETGWRDAGRGIVQTFIKVLHVAVFVVRTIAAVFRMLKAPVDLIVQSIFNISGAIKKMIGGDIIGGLARLGVALFDALVSPLRMFLISITQAMNLVGMGGLVPQSVQTFIDKGATGLIFPEAMKAKKGLKGFKLSDDEEGPENIVDDVFQSMFGSKTPDSILDLKAENKEMFGNMMKKLPEAAQSLEDAAKSLSEKEQADINVNSTVEVDGESLNLASSRHKKEVKERAGSKETPYQRRVMMEHGATTN
jgi:hypothetical protein